MAKRITLGRGAADEDVEIADAENCTILDILSGNNVVSIERDGDSFIVSEECDQWYGVILSRDELKRLAREIMALALGRDLKTDSETPECRPIHTYETHLRKALKR